MSDAAREIENLLYTYAERIDAGDLEGVAALFEHGSITSAPKAPVEKVARGRDAVLELYQGSTRLYEDGTPRTKHVTTNAIIEVENNDRASARSCYTVFQQLVTRQQEVDSRSPRSRETVEPDSHKKSG